MKVYYSPKNTNNFVFMTNNYINNEKSSPKKSCLFKNQAKQSYNVNNKHK